MGKVNFVLNDNEVCFEGPLTKRLLDVLREDFHLTGPKEGCAEGECGACAVLIDGKIVNSCLQPIGNVEGLTVITIEGFSKTKRYEVIAETFEDGGAVQCGFCTPGMIIASESLLNENPHPTEEEIKQGLSGNLCRCTGYNAIISVVKKLGEREDGLW